MEIYLNLVKPVPFEVGGNGDRSGGMFRPQSNILSISRTKGPMGGNFQQKDNSEDFPFTGPPTGPKPNLPDDRIEKPGTLIDRAKDFAGEGRETLERLFGSNAKLLGIIEVRKLLQFILKNAAEDAPVLKEVVQYGASAMRAGVCGRES